MALPCGSCGRPAAGQVVERSRWTIMRSSRGPVHFGVLRVRAVPRRDPNPRRLKCNGSVAFNTTMSAWNLYPLSVASWMLLT